MWDSKIHHPRMKQARQAVQSVLGLRTTHLLRTISLILKTWTLVCNKVVYLEICLAAVVLSFIINNCFQLQIYELRNGSSAGVIYWFGSQ